MARYIDADKLMEKLKEEGRYGYLSVDDITDTPTEDVAPIIHAHWEEHCGYARCSKCKTCFVAEWEYCGHCGAKMDEVENA